MQRFPCHFLTLQNLIEQMHLVLKLGKVRPPCCCLGPATLQVRRHLQTLTPPRSYTYLHTFRGAPKRFLLPSFLLCARSSSSRAAKGIAFATAAAMPKDELHLYHRRSQSEFGRRGGRTSDNLLGLAVLTLLVDSVELTQDREKKVKVNFTRQGQKFASFSHNGQ